MKADRGPPARGHGRATASPAPQPTRSSWSITSFALYGFPESHAASFALIVYASAYLKALLPGGVLRRAAQQPADGVLPPGDAGQGRAAARRALPADRRAGVAVGLRGRGRRRHPHRPALRRRAAGRGGAADRALPPSPPASTRTASARQAAVLRCPKCGSDDERMIEREQGVDAWFCNLCAHPFQWRGYRAEAAPAKARRRPFHVDRASRRGDGHPRGRADDARLDRRAERLRLRPARGAVAGGARDPAGGGAVRRAAGVVGGRPRRRRCPRHSRRRGGYGARATARWRCRGRRRAARCCR